MYARARIPVQHGLHMALRPHEDLFSFIRIFCLSLQPKPKHVRIMTANETIKKGWTREDFLALLERGRQIKARRQKEAEEWYAERQRCKKEAAESGYYDLEWI